jgi:hypothetical protein
MRRDDCFAALVLWIATFVIFSSGADRLGFYYDDGPALASLPQSGLRDLASHVRNYVPGRNLHVVWQYLFLRLSPDWTVLHVIQSALDGLVVVVFYGLLRRLELPAPASALAAALFAFWPQHGETHFWLYAVPQNVLSTLAVLLFALTRHPLFCLAALFTYDQTVFVLLALVVLRRHPSGLLYLIPAAFFAWLKIAQAPGRGPELRSGALRILLANIPGTVTAVLRPPSFDAVTPFDWLLAALATLTVAVVALRCPTVSAPLRLRLVAVAGGLYVAAYLPIWLWHMSQRHHYLPSAALFAGVAAGLARLPRRALAAVLPLVFAFAAASRGESRYWEESFQRKKQLFTALAPRLRGSDVLVLEGFPLNHGPAYFITPPDAVYGPRLLVPGATIAAGDISSFPAPRGVFLYTSMHHHGREAFRYYPTDRVVYANPPRAVPYEALRYDDPGASVRFHFAAPLRPGRYLAAVISYLQPDGSYHPWEGPILLAASGPYALRLRSFPNTSRAIIEFYEAGPDDPPGRLGRQDLVLQP